MADFMADNTSTRHRHPHNHTTTQIHIECIDPPFCPVLSCSAWSSAKGAFAVCLPGPLLFLILSFFHSLSMTVMLAVVKQKGRGEKV